jgi:hypothetical protein
MPGAMLGRALRAVVSVRTTMGIGTTVGATVRATTGGAAGTVAIGGAISVGTVVGATGFDDSTRFVTRGVGVGSTNGGSGTITGGATSAGPRIQSETDDIDTSAAAKTAAVMATETPMPGQCETGGRPGSEQDAGKREGDVVDAEFEVVDDDKKK